MQKHIIIVAGGSGSRMQSAIPKQFLLLAGIPVLMHTLNHFHAYDKDAVLIAVLPAGETQRWAKLCEQHKFTIPHQIAIGGPTRFHSVQNGLTLIKREGLVAVHDAVRPFVKGEWMDKLFETAANKGNAIPVVPVVETLRQYTGANSKALQRSEYCMVQTPQVFNVELLKRAYQQAFSDSFTDDATVVEALGEPIYLEAGDVQNIKITTPADLWIAESFITQYGL